MKDSFRPGEKILVASPMLIIALVGFGWQLQKHLTQSPQTPATAPEPYASSQNHGTNSEHTSHDSQHEAANNQMFSEPTPQPTATVAAPPAAVVSSSQALEIPVSGGGSIEFSPDSKRLAVFSSDEMLNFAGGSVYDLVSGALVCSLQMPASQTVVFNTNQTANARAHISYFPPLWSPDGKLIASLPTEAVMPNRPKIAIWNAASGELRGEYNNEFFVSTMFGAPAESPLLFSPDSKTLTTARGEFRVLDVAKGEYKIDHEYMRRPRKKPVPSMLDDKFGLEIRMSDDQNGQTNGFLVRDFKTKRVLWQPKIRNFQSYKWSGEVLCVADNPKFVNGKRQGEARLMLWDCKTRQLLPEPTVTARASIEDFNFSSDGKTISYYNFKITKTQGEIESWGDLIVWNYRENRVVWRTPAKGWLRHLQSSPNGQWVVAFGNASLERNVNDPFSIFVYDETGKLRYERETSSEYYRFSPDGKQLAVTVMGKGQRSLRDPKSIEVQSF